MQRIFAQDTDQDSRGDFPILIATRCAGARQRKAAFSAFIVIVVMVVAVAPFANIRLARVDAFIPAIQTAMFATNILTSAFLFAQYSVYPQRGLLALASGFMSSGLFALIQTLAFPGAYAPAGVIGDGLNSQSWLFMFWHTLFPLSVIAYSLSKDEPATRSGMSTGTSIGIVIACVVAATAGLTWVATAGAAYLPSFFENEVQRLPFANAMSLFVLLLSGAALALLFIRSRTILDVWLMVTLLAWLPDFMVGVFFSLVRFTLGWYVGRAYALIAGSALLVVLLTETLFLYMRLAGERAYRHAILDTVVDGIISIDDRGTVETMNPAAARIFGYSPEEVIGRNVKMLMPEPYCREHDTYLTNYLKTGQAKVIGIGRELTGLRKNGSMFPMELAVGETAVTGRRIFTGVVRDSTRRKRGEKHRDLLISELDHRVKNILARVAVAAKFTSRGGGSIQERFRAFDHRIQSMADAHTLLSQSHWQGVSLSDLVRRQLAPYTTSTNMTIAGPDVVLAAEETQAVAMVLQELVTNAVKYGSLTTANGRISVSWDRQSGDHGTPRVIIAWREIGGPSAMAPAQPGYGTRLIRGLIPQELGGTVDLVFATDGVCCNIEFPVAST